MKSKGIHKRTRGLLGMLGLAALVIAFFPMGAIAQVSMICNVNGEIDSDCDGFQDSLELSGIPLGPSQDSVVTNPGVADVFVIFVPAVPTNIPLDGPDGDPFEFLKKRIEEGGLGITLHVISEDQTFVNRRVTSSSPQKAAKLTESLDTVGDELGVAQHGGPNGNGGATFFSQRLINFVEGVYEGKGQVPPEGLIAAHNKNTVAHEIGHVLGLTAEYDRRFGGNHFKSGEGVMMEEAPKVRIQGSTITFFLSDEFAPESPQQACLNVLDEEGVCQTELNE